MLLTFEFQLRCFFIKQHILPTFFLPAPKQNFWLRSSGGSWRVLIFFKTQAWKYLIIKLLNKWKDWTFKIAHPSWADKDPFHGHYLGTSSLRLWHIKSLLPKIFFKGLRSQFSVWKYLIYLVGHSEEMLFNCRHTFLLWQYTV